MNERVVYGINPLLPWPLNRSPWWTEPVRAERLAALRIGIALVLLLDVFAFYYPHAIDFFGMGRWYGTGSLGGPDVFQDVRYLPAMPWSLLSSVQSPLVWKGILLVWAASAVLLLLGVWPQPAAGLAWLIAGCVHYVNPFIFNAGDAVRNIALFYLMISPCGAAWSLGRGASSSGPVFVVPWPLRLLFVQLALIYFVTGVSKLAGQWFAGDSMYYVTANITWMRWPPTVFALPYPITQGLGYFIVAWELTFPIFASWPRTRWLTLAIGVLFHVGSGVALKLALFPLYMLCLYLPLLPWERWCGARQGPGLRQDEALLS